MFFFLMIRRPPRSTLDRSSAASDVYKRQVFARLERPVLGNANIVGLGLGQFSQLGAELGQVPVSYTHLRAHETVLDLVCRLLLEKTKNNRYSNVLTIIYIT